MRHHVFVALAVVMTSTGCAVPSSVAPADLVLRNGTIVTLDADHPEVSALAARDGRIVAVGSDPDIDGYVGPGTRVVDLQGRMAIPGLIEGHGHYMSFGASLLELDLRGAPTWDAIVEQVAAAVAGAPAGAWIVGGGWHQDRWERRPEPSVEGLPLHAALSAVSPDNPVFLSHTSGHGVFVNARALEAAGITRSTPHPVGGEIVRDADGDAIGMLRETAAAPVREALASYRANRPSTEIEAELREQVRLAGEAAVANGITSFQDMGSSFETVDLLRVMADEGNLPVRLYVALDEPAADLADRLADYRMVGYGGGFLTVRAIGEKVLDGALGTHGGWLLEPYADLPPRVGFRVTPIDDIRQSADLAIVHDYQMAIQGIGDRAVRRLFEVYEAAFAASPGKGDFRWRIEHAQVVHPDDLPRFARLGVIPGIQGVFACSDGPWVIDRLGQARAQERGYLFRSLLDAGAVVMNGTDPPVEAIDPIASFDCTVTRRLPDGSFFFPEQTLTRMQALESYTINNAYAAFEEDIKGSLTPGKLADITVLSKNILTIPDDEIRTTEVVYTIIGGKVVYER